MQGEQDILVQFLTFEGCPRAGATRDVLERALADCGLAGYGYQEVDVLHPDTSPDLRNWGSPTILVNGTDVSDQPQGSAASCRVYDGPGGAPKLHDVAEAIRRAAAAGAPD